MDLTRRSVIGMGLGAIGGVMFSRRASAAFSLEIMAPYYKSLPTMAPIAVALELGLYAKHGVDVTGVITSVGGGTGLRNMLGANLGYAEMGTASVLAGFKAGIDVRIVHDSVNTSEDIVWVTMPDSGITSIKDLAGKKVGISSPRSTSETLAKMAEEAAGMGGQMKLIAVGQIGSGLSAMENGGLDSMFIMEPLFTERSGKYRVVFTQEGLPRMSQDVGIATQDFMKQHPEELRGIIAGRRDAVDFIYANLDEAAKITSKRYGDTLPADAATVVMRHLAGLKYWSRGNIDQPSVENVVNGLIRQGQWEGPVEWDKIIDRQFLPKDLQT
ncbi:MAG TPA: ABC transporter substrate-binding protein [Aliidongia sp.]|uniref:ABC transporter substrate-binding protein n=1 Tax=Aliidongia sp. TaxID=1914230 RepID=UPI002DDCF3C6|nr:ABC transporter substrate-binding protein [Aliidongia sp.]HEV2677364.1 ABC transporter substrate-binding protein [Aliidongia sp.]